MQRFIVFLFLLLLVAVSNAAAARESIFVAPALTDPQIDRNLQNHYVAIDTAVQPKNLLYVFLPGTGGFPVFYREIANNAADNGFHSIGLNYAADDAVNLLCGQGNTDLDCYSDVRLEVIDGTDRTTLVDVNRPNSIENRLIKLLTHLNTTRPGENWNQFLDGSGNIEWSKIVIAGHSQGGGHAGIIGRYHLVRRVLMFAAADFNGPLQRAANWIAFPETTPNASPPDRFWAFSHQFDESVSYANQIGVIWPAYSMTRFGPSINVDGIAAPYTETHSLTSVRDCDNYHGCIAADPRLVFENGIPVYKPVWDYMLSNAESTVSVSEVNFKWAGLPVSRPPVGSVSKRYRLVLRGIDIGGIAEARVNDREAAIISNTDSEIEITLPAGKLGAVGSSVVKLRSSNGMWSNAIRF